MELGQEWYEWGLWGLFFATFLSATLIPLASELLLLFMLSQGYNALLLLIISTTGNWLGGMTTYAIGWILPFERIPQWFRGKQEAIESWVLAIRKNGSKLALLCWMPIVGDLVALALGSARTNVFLTGGYMLVGKAVRYCVVIWLWTYS